MAPAGDEEIDPRADRAAQSTIGVVLLAAFVFRVPWLLPVVAALVALGALGGVGTNPLHYAFRRWIGPRLPAPTPAPAITPETVRRQDALAAVLLGVASLLYVLGLTSVGWALAIVEAVIAILAATTRVHVADRIRRPR